MEQVCHFDFCFRINASQILVFTPLTIVVAYVPQCCQLLHLFRIRLRKINYGLTGLRSKVFQLGGKRIRHRL